MKAVIICDRYDDIKIKEDLYSFLKQHKINQILEFKNLDHLKENFKYLSQEEIYLFFPSIYIRYSCLPQIIKLHSTNSFGYMKIVDHTVSFIPSKCAVTRDSVGAKDVFNKELFFRFKNPKLVTYVKPKVDTPRIILYTHNRNTYLNLTLNSLMYSLEQTPEVPVTLILNDPTKEITNIAYNFMDRYDQIDVLRVKENAIYGGFNIGLQWFKPKTVILAEDDFILPEATKHLYPLWALQFSHRLNYFDFIGWRPLFNNLPYNKVTDWENPQSSSRLGWLYHDNTKTKFKDKNFTVLCQLACFKTDFWKKCFDPKIKGCTDVLLQQASENLATPYLEGYHFSWNQPMDSIDSKKNWLQGFNLPHDKVHVKNVRTGENRIIYLKQIQHL